MGYENHHAFVDEIAEKYRNTKDVQTQFAYLSVLHCFSETVLKGARYGTQRGYVKRTIYELNLSYADGYYGTYKPTKK